MPLEDVGTILQALDYNYMGMIDRRRGWAKSAEGVVLTVSGYSAGLGHAEVFRITAQNTIMTQMVALDNLTLYEIATRMVHYECCLLNGIESLRRDL